MSHKREYIINELVKRKVNKALEFRKLIEDLSDIDLERVYWFHTTGGRDIDVEAIKKQHDIQRTNKKS